MSEERLQEIKDSVNFQREILLAHNMGTLCVDEEQELIEEIERLNNIIKKYDKYAIAIAKIQDLNNSLLNDKHFREILNEEILNEEILEEGDKK